MKKISGNIAYKLLICFACAGIIIAACIIFGKTRNSKDVCPAPFSELTWKSTYEDMVSIEGKAASSYDSIYGGQCYTYAKEFDSMPGTIKYMFDGDNALMSIAWSCSAENIDQLDSIYKKIESDVISKYGESGYKPQGGSNYGNVWYLDSGNIILSAVTTSDAIALQYSYLHPDVSHEKPQ